MPQGDKTGPTGQGPMTGRRMGSCAGNDMPRSRNFGMGRGLGRGFAWRARAMPQSQPTVITEEQEKQFLEQELTALKEEMKEIEKRLKGLKD
ncbi:DUF5320 domain-containing protein [Candidatus Pacearchaeota archaeon]|nr:DUF5320 domain-containing protein [Candidatus Pacearchaeota archaeon]